MASTLYVASNPSDGVSTYQRVLVERAPDSGGAPGAFTQIANIAVDASNESTSYTDLGGTTTDWYRHRWSNTGLTTFSDYSSTIQAGDYVVRQWIKADIPDADLTNADWDRWRDQAFAELAANWLMKASTTLSTTVATGTEYISLPAAMRRVIRVDAYFGGFFAFTTADWVQEGRQVRIFGADPTLTYVIHGLSELKTWADLDNELFMLVYWYMRLKYIDKRLAERTNFKMFVNADKQTELGPAHFLQLRAAALGEFNDRLNKAKGSLAMPLSTP